jgi:hypothetical protein
VKKFVKEKVEIADEAIKKTKAPWKRKTVKNPITAYCFNLTLR